MSDDGQFRFDDGKDAAAMRTIGEVATAFGIRQHVLRYWEQQFPMLRPLKRSGGRRYYRPEDVALVETIDRLINREGYTLKGARQAIERGTVAPSTAATATPAAVSSTRYPDVLPQLRAIRQRLANALAA
jgi:DNA-binding transcriptional MerR regulator